MGQEYVVEEITVYQAWGDGGLSLYWDVECTRPITSKYARANRGDYTKGSEYFIWEHEQWRPVQPDDVLYWRHRKLNK